MQTEAVEELKKLHLSVIALLELANATFGGNAKGRFRFTFWCTLGMIAPSQSAIPYDWKNGDPLHLALVFSWLLLAIVRLITVIHWLVKPLKEVGPPRWAIRF